MTHLVGLKVNLRPVGIRQRSLTRHCRLGRATELVVILATGTTLVLGGVAQAEDLFWDPGVVGFPGSGGSVPGTWDVNTTSDWTNAANSVRRFQQDDNVTFALTGGVVTVDESFGAVRATDASIEADGYTIQGDPIEITGTLTLLNPGESLALDSAINNSLDIAGAGDMTVTGGSSGGITQGTSGTVTLSGGTYGDGTNGWSQSSGETVVAVDSAITGALLNGAGTVTVDAALTIDTTAINSDILVVNGSIIGGQVVNNSGGTVTLNGDITGSYVQDGGGDLTTVTGASSVSGGMNIDTGTLTLSDTLASNVDLAAATVFNQNAALTGNLVTASADANIDADINGTVTQSAGQANVGTAATITGLVTVNGGTFTVDAAGTVLDAGVTVASGGTLELNAQTTLNADSDSDGTLTINTTVLGGTALTNTGAATLAGSLSGGYVQDTDGTATTEVTGALSVAGGMNIDTGTLTLSDTLASDVDLAAATVFNQNAALTGNLVTASADANIDADITGSVTQSAGQTNVGTAASITGLVTVNGGTFTVDAAGAVLDAGVTVASGGTLELNAQTTLNADSDSDGILTVNTTVLGGTALTNTGAATLAGSLSGGYVQDTDGTATTEVTGALSVAGGMNIDTGTLTLSDTLASDVDLAAATVLNQNAALTGNLVTASADANIDADITGTVTQSAGQANVGTAATITGLITVNGGTFTVDAAGTVLDAGVTVASGGTLELNAQTTLNADSDSDGILTVNTTVLGGTALTNTGAATLAGSLSGGYVQDTDGTATTEVTGALSVAGGMNIDTGTLTITAATQADIDLATAATYVQNATLTGALSTASSNADIAADVTGAITQTGGQVNVTGAATIGGLADINAGTFEIDAATVLSSGFDVAAGARLQADAQTTLGADSINAGTLDINADILGGRTIANSGTATLAADITGVYSQTAGTTNVDGTASVSGATSVSGGSFTVDAGQIFTAGGGIAISGTGALHNSGTITGSVSNTGTGASTLAGTVTGDFTQNNAGATTTIAGATDIDGSIVNTAGTIDLNADLTVGGDLTNGGSITNISGGTFALTLDSGSGVFTSTGIINAGAGEITISAFEVVLTGGHTETGNVVFLTSIIDYGSDQSLTGIQNYNMSVQSGVVITITGDTTIGASDAIDDIENAGTININAGQTLSAGTISNTATGTIDLAANATLQGTDNTLNNAGAIVVADGGTVEDAGAINNLAGGTITFNGNADFDADSDNSGGEIITNDGTITVQAGGGTVVVGNDDLTNQGVGTVAVDTGTMNGIATLTNTSTSATAITVASGATLGFTDLNSSAGMIVAAGTLDGDVTLTGVADLDLNAGSITGALTNRSATEITLAGALGSFVQDTNASAATVVDGATTVTGGMNIDTGTLTVNATLASDVDVAAGTTYDQNAALTGNLTTASSAATIGADITGTVTQTAGQTNVDGATTISGLVDVDGGIFEIDAATTLTSGFNVASGAEVQIDADTTLGAASTNDGTLDINGNVLGGQTVTNTGAATLAGDITGDFVQNADATAETTVDGATSVSGGMNIDTGTLTVNAALTSDVDLAAGTTYDQNAALTGDLTTAASAATIGADITGTVTQTAGQTNVDGAATISGLVTVSGGSFEIDAAATLTSGFDVAAGAELQIDADTTLGAASVNAGTLDINANILGNQTITNTGTATLAADITGSYDQTAGTTTIDGDTGISGTTTVSAGDFVVLTGQTFNAIGGLTLSGTAVLTNSGTITGTVTNNSTGVYTLSGDITDTFTQDNAAAVTVVAAASNMAGGFVINAGDLTVNADLTLGADSSNDGTLDVNGTILGGRTITNTGTAELAGDITGSFVQNTDATATTTVDGISSVSGGMTIDTGTLTVNAALTSDVDLAAGTTYDQNAALTGDLTTASSAATIGADITGTVTQTAGQTNVDGAATISGLVNIDGGLFEIDAPTTLTSGFDVASGAEVQVDAATTLGADSVNAGTLDVNANVLGGQTITNTGTAELAADITGAYTQTAGTTTVDGASAVSGATTVSGGTFTVEAGNTFTATGGLDVTGTGALDLNDTVDGDVTRAGTGTSLLAGTITGDYDQTAGATTVDGDSTIQGDLSVTGGTLTVAAAQTLNAQTIDNSAAIVLQDDATLHGTGNTLVNSGTITVADGGALTDVGEINNLAAATITFDGNATFDSDTDASGGEIITNGGAIVVQAGTGTVAVGNDDLSNQGAGTLTVTSGTMNGIATLTNTSISAAAIDVASGAELGFDALASSAGTITSAGTLTGDVILTGAAALDLTNGTIDGDLTNQATDLALSGATITGDYSQTAALTTTVTGATSIGGTVTNPGTFDVAANFTFGAFTNSAGDDPDVVDDGGVAERLTNGGGVIVRSGGSMTGTTLTNTGVIGLETGSTLGATSFTNSGRLEANGSVTVQGSLTNTGIIDMLDGDTGDVITINGDAVLDGDLFYDVNVSGIDIAGGAADTSDLIAVNGDISGTPTFHFTNINGTVFAGIGGSIDLVTYTGDNNLSGTVSTTGLPTNGPFLYQINTDTDGTIQLESIANSAFGGLASGVAATQGMIATVINRPSAALVTPLVDPGDDPCARGAWIRMTGGESNASLKTQNVGAGNSATNDISLSYSGFQLGLDRSCSGGFHNGWDIAVGPMLGFNSGSSSLPVDTTLTVNNKINTDFEQYFGGVYLNFARGNFFGDIMFRADTTSYDLRETVDFANGGLGIASQSYTSSGMAISGSLSYSHLLNQDLNLRIVPTVGFALTRISVDDIEIEGDPNSTADDSVLQIDTINQKIALVGATLVRTQVLPGDRSALTYFGTATYFNDFGSDISSSVDATNNSTAFLSENLGGFGEISVGMNLTRLFGAGSALPLRQLDASIRADSRFSNKMDSWGVTLQARLQF
ncbi:Flagellar hook-length control protein FliK [Rhodovulum sp. P5]|uniref:beta strand repeat-containing protein n=1 Tax=Rhodovulum sp. P5 TaxID=1564506 RepID=UPI0009C35BA4|nr:hypothetical protein [Rhodovulum sp. P5]ARE41191.1 Flagellar hook-length control protein FliK [Rhodovulum sp. P5]